MTTPTHTNNSNIQELIQQAKALCEQEKFLEAIRDLCGAYNSNVQDTDKICQILQMRGRTYCKLCEFYLNYPADLSEKGGVLFGYEPLWLAHLAQLDAARLLDLLPDNIQTYYLAGDAAFLYEKYEDAKQYYLKGLSLNPEDQYLHQKLVQVNKEFKEANKGSIQLKQASDMTEVECSVCYRLLFEPVSTPCGHTFCRTCLARSLANTSKCPICRTVLHMGQELPVTLVLKNLIKRVFAEEYEQRRLEEEGEETSVAGGILPVFVMDILLPGESIALNIFEPRYRLMIRRCLAGNQKFAMAISRNGSLDDIATEVQIRECQPLADGRFYLEVIAISRIKIVESWEQDGYRVARFKYYVDEKKSEDTFQTEKELPALIQDLCSRIDKANSILSGINTDVVRSLQFRAGSRPNIEDLEAFTFWLAIVSRLGDPDRIEVLRMNSGKQRAQYVYSKMQNETCRFM